MTKYGELEILVICLQISLKSEMLHGTVKRTCKPNSNTYGQVSETSNNLVNILSIEAIDLCHTLLFTRLMLFKLNALYSCMGHVTWDNLSKFVPE